MRNVGCAKQDMEWGMGNGEWGMRNAECGMLNEFAEEMDQFRFTPPLSQH